MLAEASIVEKHRKCTDFTVTVFIVHLGCMIVGGFGVPSLWMVSWWVYHTIIITVVTALSEVVINKLEMQEIHLSVNDLSAQAKIFVRQVVQGK